LPNGESVDGVSPFAGQNVNAYAESAARCISWAGLECGGSPQFR
jgi:hypothetical protein